MTAFAQNRNQIITRALRILGVVEQGGNPTATQIAEGAIAFSAILETLYNENIRFWKTSWLTKTFTGSSEVLGSDGNNYRCIRPHTSAADNKPVTGANYTTYWVLGGSAGVAWVTATAYTSNGVFSLSTLDANASDILNAMIRHSGYDIPVRIVDDLTYANICQKDIEGESYSLWVQRNNGTTRGTCYLWPQPNDNADVLHCLTIISPDTALGAGESVDFPLHWTDALTFMLANNLGWEYQIPADVQGFLSNKAKGAKELAKKSDTPILSGQCMKSLY